MPSRFLTPALSSYQVWAGQTAPALVKARPPLGRRLIAGVFVVDRWNLSRRLKITPRNVSYESVIGVSPAKRPERPAQYSRPPSPTSRAPTMLCVGHESVVVLGPVGAGLPAKRPEKTAQYSRPPSPASRAPTMFCVGHESVVFHGPVGAGLPAKRPERPAQYSRPPSPASRAPTMFCVGHESVVFHGPVIGWTRPSRGVNAPRWQSKQPTAARASP